MSFSCFGGQSSKVEVTRDKMRLALPTPTRVRTDGMRSSVQQQRTGAFHGWRMVTSAACVRCQGSVSSRNWVTWLRGAVRIGAAVLLKAVWWDLRLACLLTHLIFLVLISNYGR